MMNKIIWKDTESTEIKGLMICELPPISKPKMRVQETTIDGVDGSIIEELGYESYDKTIKIGLHKNFDIDEVIEYFTGEGQVIFSNEPDKYYKAKIIDQIDYERLLRFRTATVKFRVQPFKYELDEETIIKIASNNLYNINDCIYEGTYELNEDWITYAKDGYIYPNTSKRLKANTPYKIIVEIEEANNMYIKFRGAEHYQFKEESDKLSTVGIHILDNSTNEGDIYNSSLFVNAMEIMIGYIDTTNRTGSIKFRISILEDTTITEDTFAYEKYKDIESVDANNNGNYFSKPIIKLKGSGTVEFLVNSMSVFTYKFPNNENEVTIDSEKEDAYLANVLKNRNMTGDFPTFKTGENTISWNGTITSIEVEQRSRWL